MDSAQLQRQGAPAAEQLTSVIYESASTQDPHDGGQAYVDMAAASASSYGIPATGGLAVDPAYPAVAHEAYANAAAAAHHATDGIEYMALAASAAEHSIAAAARTASPAATGAGGTPQAHPHAQDVHQPGEVAQAHTLAPNYANQSITSRQAMDLLLAEQKQAMLNVGDAEQELARAHANLAEAKRQRDAVDERVAAHAATLVDDLLAEDTRWNEMYRRLIEFKAENGHCHVMRNPVSNGKLATSRRKGAREKDELRTLGSWVGQCRLDARRPAGHPERLEPYKVSALDRLGFDWEPRENYWMEMYQQLKTYLDENGGKMPPRYRNNKKFPLGQWCDTQLDNYRKLKNGKKGAYITQEKIEMLTEIGFIWDKRGQLWRENYERLKDFHAQHGHCNATASNNGGDKSFGTWVTKQKRKYVSWRNGITKSLEHSLSDEQAALMDAIGFGENADIDGRKMRGRSPSYSGPSRPTIAGLVNASEELEDRPGEEEAGASENVANESMLDAGTDPSAVANAWGASANAVSMLVDAIMAKEGHSASQGAADGDAAADGLNITGV